jgi:hypothetical protein
MGEFIQWLKLINITYNNYKQLILNMLYMSFDHQWVY